MAKSDFLRDHQNLDIIFTVRFQTQTRGLCIILIGILLARYTDHPAKDISCDLCAHERLRYEHIIQNTKTQEKKSVGSSCILKLAEIAVYDEQGRVTTNSAEREQALKKAFQRFKFKLSLVPLRELYRVMFEADQRKLANIVEFVKEKGSFPPNDLVWVFSSMKDRGISHFIK